MKQTKRIFAMAVSAILAVSSMTAMAADEVVITHHGVENGELTVTAENKGDASTILVLVLEKTDVVSADQNDITYGIRDAQVEAGKTATFTLTIPDSKNGVSSSGAYIIKVQDENDHTDSATFLYAVPADITAFVESLDGVAAGDRLSLFTNPANKAVLVTIGLDYDAFMAADPAVQQNAVDTLYNNGVATLNKDTFSDAFLSAFGLAVYNTGDKMSGLAALSPKYNGGAADTTLFPEVLSMMDPSYTTTQAFVDDFAVNYGLVTVNNASVSNMGQVLTAFKNETGKCATVIDNINNLGPLPKRTAAEYIVPQLNANPATTPEALEPVLAAAYNAAVGSVGGGAGGGAGGGVGGGFGGGFGSVDNTKDNQPGSVGAATGSGTYEDKVGESMVFTDLPGSHWAAESVRYLKAKGIVSGTGTGAFEPDRAVTREEFAKMLVAACGFAIENKDVDFDDVADGAWYIPYIGTAAEQGIVNGIGDNKFGIGQNITRQDMAVMVKRAMDAKKLTLNPYRAYDGFADEADIADYAKDAVKALYEAKIINGKDANSFDPAGNATRAEAAKIIYEAFKGGI